MRQPTFGPQARVDALEVLGAGRSISEVCAKLGISETTLYSWKSKYAGMSAAQIARLDQLVQRCALQAERIGALESDVRVLQDALQMQALSPGEKRRPIRIFQSRYGLSLSRLCRLMSISRSFYAYQSMREPGMATPLLCRVGSVFGPR